MKSTKEEARSLASEIIADLQKKLQVAESQNTSDILRNLIERNNNQSDKITELSNIMEKLGHIAMNFSDRYELDSDKEKNERNACIFFAERENMYCDIRILCDYFCQAQGIVENLESVR